MTWTAPKTFVSLAVLTAAELNTHLRDNLLETAPAKASAAGQIFVSTAANAIAARTITTDRIDAAEATSSTSYTNLGSTGPTVSVTTGTSALVVLSAQAHNTTVNLASAMGYAVSGATTIAADDSEALLFLANATFYGHASFVSAVSLTAGTNTFTAKYRSDGGSAAFQYRRLTVIPL